MTDHLPKKKSFKNPIKFAVTLNEEQKEAKAIVLQNKAFCKEFFLILPLHN